jgi:DNA-binding LacI/PurR family transcriptional regulator
MIDVNNPSLEDFHRVVVDDVEGGHKATQHLIELGHERIGFIGDRIDGPFAFTSSHHRLQGYLQACQQAGLDVPDSWQGYVEYGRNAARRMARGMLSNSDRPTAVFAASDTQALGILEAAQDLGLNVPGDLSVIGYDDIEMAEYFGLTTVRQSLYESGAEGVKILFQIMQNPPASPVAVTLPTELVIRTSTAPPG